MKVKCQTERSALEDEGKVPNREDQIQENESDVPKDEVRNGESRAPKDEGEPSMIKKRING